MVPSTVLVPDPSPLEGGDARLTKAQAETARRIQASPDGLIYYMGGPWKTLVPDPPGDPEWTTTAQSIRRMQAAGWLEPSGLHPDEPWADPRRLTAAGRGALAAFEAWSAAGSRGGTTRGR